MQRPALKSAHSRPPWQKRKANLPTRSLWLRPALAHRGGVGQSFRWLPLASGLEPVRAPWPA
jgi:hypothetical protein